MIIKVTSLGGKHGKRRWQLLDGTFLTMTAVDDGIEVRFTRYEGDDKVLIHTSKFNSVVAESIADSLRYLANQTSRT